MGALPNKKTSVVAIETARRRRRRPAGPDKPNPPSSASVVALAVALVIAAAATTFGVWVVGEFIQRGNYVGAAVAPFWVIVPGCAPLAVLIVKRRRAARSMRSNVTRLSNGHHPRKPVPRGR